ncbi:DNA polymerase III subunit alpha [Bauldia sp.]|uniref:DNA polymerase III subunit alpha n=1 Tax=Bauldia sp. TaxID=2575872 RepID=UPI003BABE458
MSRIAEDVGFVHLRVHSAFSLLEGALPLKELAKLAAADRMPALGIADTGNLFGALEFCSKMAAAGVQPIVGCQIAVDFGDSADAGRTGGSPQPGRLSDIVLIAATEQGYWNLVKLVSISFMESDAGDRPHLRIDQLATAIDGLIALTGGPGGPVDRALAAGQSDIAAARLDRLAGLYPDALYVELQRHGLSTEQAVEPDLVDLAYARNLPLVATNEPFFPTRDDFEAHDALICIAEGTVIGEDNRRRLTPEHAFKSRAEMVELFADLPEALANTVEVAMRVAYWPVARQPILPRFVSAGDDAEAAEAKLLREEAAAGLERRLAAHGMADGLSEEDYKQRLAFELDVIEGMKYPGYFLIVADFIQWAKAQGIPVGPGRGSGAGSVVAWSLTITDLDPLRFSLLFERFLNPDRVSMPDFDVDFCQNRRDEVIRYVQGKYGVDQVAQIITFGSLQARACLRDVGRVLQMPYGQVDRIAKMVPQNPANPVTLRQAIADEPRLQAEAEKETVVERLLTIAQKLEGLYRHASTHAAGVVIGDRPLDQLVPLYRDPRSGMKVTQFNMKWVEEAGLVKFDFLGLKTLTVLDIAARLVRRRSPDFDLATLPLDDTPTFDMLTRGETVGVFQLESGGMRRAVIDMKPDRFDDLIALVALYRPGPMANIPTYCMRKHGKEVPDYIHPLLEPTLKETYGVIVYQEQVMKIAQILAGYSLAEADLLRRAMGKKIRSEMQKQQNRFVEGAVERGVDRHQAESIFSLLAKFAEYGFPKGHAAAYALVAYQTAYMKANHPAEFMAASMTLDAGNTDKIAEFRREAIRIGIEVEAPSVNRSGVTFDVADGRILYSLAAIKGVGAQAVEHLVDARASQPFRDLAGFADRVDPRVLNKRSLESLVAAGAFDEIEPDRARVFAAIDRLLGLAARRQDSAAVGQSELFGNGAAEPIVLPVVEPWQAAEKLQREHDAVGFYLSAHPLDEYKAILDRMRVQSWAEFAESVRRGATAGRLAGTVTAKQERRIRSGNRMGAIQLSDPSGAYEAVVFSESLAEYRDLLEPGRSIVALVSAEERPEGINVRIQSVEPLDQFVRGLKQLRVFVRDDSPLPHLKKQLDPKGEGAVSMIVMLENGAREIEVRLPGKFAVSPQIAGALRTIRGVEQVELA